MRKTIIAIMLTTALAAGCAVVSTNGHDFKMSDVDAMRPGVTTYDEAVQKLGTPASQGFNKDGAKRVMWSYVRVDGAKIESRAVAMEFDKDGKMVRVANRAGE